MSKKIVLNLIGEREQGKEETWNESAKPMKDILSYPSGQENYSHKLSLPHAG